MLVSIAKKLAEGGKPSAGLQWKSECNVGAQHKGLDIVRSGCFVVGVLVADFDVGVMAGEEIAQAHPIIRPVTGIVITIGVPVFVQEPGLPFIDIITDLGAEPSGFWVSSRSRSL